MKTLTIWYSDLDDHTCSGLRLRLLTVSKRITVIREAKNFMIVAGNGQYLSALYDKDSSIVDVLKAN